MFRLCCTLTPASLISFFFIFKLIWGEWAVGKFFYKTVQRLCWSSLSVLLGPRRGVGGTEIGCIQGLGEGWLRRPVTPDPRPVPGLAPGAARWLPSGAIWWPEAPQRRLHRAGTKRRRFKTSKSVRTGRSLTLVWTERASGGRSGLRPRTLRERSAPSRPPSQLEAGFP